MTLTHESTVACQNCRFAAIKEIGYFDYRRFPLGGVRYPVVGFHFCMECGVTHCVGYLHGIGSDERSDLFAQPGPLFLVKAPVTVWRDGQEFEDLEDAIEANEWLPCDAKRHKSQEGRQTVEGIWYSGQYSCSVCKVPGTLVGFLEYGWESLWRCPMCRKQSLSHSYAGARYKGMAPNINV